jgi:hypothetical protein
VNGDGIDDLIVGAPTGDDGGSNAGEAYVIYGVAGTTRGTVDLTGLAASDGFIIQGDAAIDQAGQSVSSAGDVNGDGIDDLIVGAIGGDDGGSNAGEAYVIYGVAGTTRGTVDLTGLAASDGFIIQGDEAIDQAGYSVSSAGDVNGDGFDDLIVGAPNGDDGGSSAGEAYVIYGMAGTSRTTVDLTGLAASDGFVIQGDVAGDQAGRSVSSAGDVNGDGIDDLIVGAPVGDDGGTAAGEAYVIFGRAGATRGTLDLSTLSPLDGFIIQGDAADDRAGFSVSSAGDVNGDGIDDLVVGAHFGDDGGSNAGEAYVIYGRRPTLAVDRTGTDIGQAIFGGHLEDTLSGLGGDDTLYGGAGGDTLNGGDGVDRIFGEAGADVLTGGAGNDLLDGGAGADTMAGGLGNDRYVVDDAGDVITGETGFSLGGGIDTVFSLVDFTLPANVEIVRLQGMDGLSATGSAAYESFVGNAGNNTINARGGNDVVNGKDGDDTIIGGTGRDTLVGEAGADAFVYLTIADSYAGATTRDLINGFVPGTDVIDLSAIDANPFYSGDQAWKYIGTTAFGATGPGSGAELRWSATGANSVLVSGDWNGDGTPEFQIEILGTNTLSVSDFVL